jgi:F420-dependent oxidoreductase-like protein
MQIGIQLTPADRHGDFVAQAAQANAAGLSGAWWPQPPPTAEFPSWNTLTSIAAVGREVPGIELGSCVVITPPQHPLILAGQALTAQALTGNRLALGVGAGHRAIVDKAYGPQPGHPARQLRAYLEVLLPALNGEHVDHHSEHLTAVGVTRIPGARPPVVLVAAHGQEMIRLAGEAADGLIAAWCGPKAIGAHIAPSLTAASSRRLIVLLPVCLTTDPDAARQGIDARFGAAATRPSYQRMLELEGADRVSQLSLIGDERQVEHGLRRLEDAGATDLLAIPYGSPDERHATSALLGQLSRRS